MDLPCIPQESRGNPGCTRWLCGSNIRSRYSSFHPSGLHNHPCRHRGSSQRCSGRWSTWRRNRCTSFLKTQDPKPITAKIARRSRTKRRSPFDPTKELDRLIPFKKSSCGSSAFCLGHMFPAVSWESGAAAADTNEEILAESPTAVLPAARHLRFRGSSSEWSGQSA